MPRHFRCATTPERPQGAALHDVISDVTLGAAAGGAQLQPGALAPLLRAQLVGLVSVQRRGVAVEVVRRQVHHPLGRRVVPPQLLQVQPGVHVLVLATCNT